MNPLVTNLTCNSNGDWAQNTRDLCGKGNDIIFVFDQNVYQQNCRNKLESRRVEKMFLQPHYVHQRYKTDTSLWIV